MEVREVWECNYCGNTNHMSDVSCVSCNGALLKGKVIRLKTGIPAPSQIGNWDHVDNPYFTDGGYTTPSARFEWDL